MKNMILFFAVLMLGEAYATDRNMYANIYADQLIQEYDKALDAPDIIYKLLADPIYSKILAARAFIEHTGKTTKFGKSSLAQVTDTQIYISVVNEINKDAQNILIHRQLIKGRESSRGLIFPSISKAGNVTGNTFPENVWTLTFDDGPHATRTKQVVDNLNYHNMKASFFMLMRQVNKYPKALDYVLASDMELALHSYNHLDLNKASAKTMDHEVSTALEELEYLSGQEVQLFRLPYGSGMRNTPLRTKIAMNKLVHLFWNVDTLDWKDKDPKSIYNRTLKQMARTPRKSGVILFHDIHSQTVIASEMIMQYLKDNNKTVCTVGEVIAYINNRAQDCLN